MLIGFRTDDHFSYSSSILSSASQSNSKYSIRLDSLINSYKWMYDKFRELKVDILIDAGDITDKDIITSEESGALYDAFSYNNSFKEYILLGNHEKKSKDNRYYSSSILNGFLNIEVIDKPTVIDIYDYKIAMLPYMSNYDEVDFSKLTGNILISHMNYKDMYLNKKTQLINGLDMKNVSELYKRVFNGHIHMASSYMNDKVINLGSISGIGFNDDYFTSYPCISVYDTDTDKFYRIENPYSVIFSNFKVKDIGQFRNLLSTNEFFSKPNPKCIKIRVPYEYKSDLRDLVESSKDYYNVVAYRLINQYDEDANFTESIEYGVERSSKTVYEIYKDYISELDTDSLPCPITKINEYIDNKLSKVNKVGDK